MKISIATKGSVAATRDVNQIIVNVQLNGDQSTSPSRIAQLIMDQLHIRNLGFLGSLMRSDDDRSADERISNFVMMAKSSAFSRADHYEDYFVAQQEFQDSIRVALHCMRNHEYIKAHSHFGAAILSGHSEAVKPQLVYDYFVSGYVGYSLVSDTEAIRRLLDQTQARYHNYFDQGLDAYIIEAHQEIGTRQSDADMLFENETMITRFLGKYGRDAHGLNLLGLLYRRLGERKSMGERCLVYLERATEVFREIEAIQGAALSVQIRNNWAIGLIRHFELTNAETSLDKAESLLEAVDYEATTLPLPDFLALPKALNNWGNVYKQRLAYRRDAAFYAPALEHYVKCERFWNERGSPYEWAMIQKNKADVRCEYLKLHGFDRRTADQALKEINQSLRYRTLERAPYQYQRSLDVKDQLQALISAN